ncbi:SDR family oxidoreductase [Actinoplanes sp. NPDC049596]|uniref:LysR family transcriptional regulator n=1 Tax=unclassified Actinoplanes TaxID=2626549 RepID=UPI00342BBE1F
MTDLDLRRLRYFLTLAGTENYGRAAEILHLAQPALSRSIAALERDLGAKLFERSRSGTRLTPVGEILRDDARELLRSAETVQRRIRVAARDGRSVTLGFLPGTIVTPLVRHLENRFPQLQVDVARTSWTGQIAGLRDGRFDACLAQRPFAEDGLTVVDLYTEPRVVALPIDHPAGPRPLDVTDPASLAAFFAGTGPFHHLAYTAGDALARATIADYDPAQARDFFDVRLFRALDAVRAARPTLDGHGSITLTAGAAAFHGGPGRLLGSTVSGAVITAARSLAIELA